MIHICYTIYYKTMWSQVAYKRPDTLEQTYTIKNVVRSTSLNIDNESFKEVGHFPGGSSNNFKHGMFTLRQYDFNCQNIIILILIACVTPNTTLSLFSFLMFTLSFSNLILTIIVIENEINNVMNKCVPAFH